MIILSDAYIGIDQEYNLHCEVVKLQEEEWTFVHIFS